MYLSIEQRIRTRPYGHPPTHLVETLLAKGSGSLNEDVLLQDGNLFGVFDGATSLCNDDLPEGTTGGLMAARIAAESFRQGNDDLLRCAEEANRQLGKIACNASMLESERFRLWSTSAAVVRLGDHHFDYCQTGDSLILTIREDGSFTILTPEIDHDRDTLKLWKNTRVPAGASIHEILSEQIRQVRNEMNITYGVLNGEPEAMHFLNHGREKTDGLAAILLFTDGLFLSRKDPYKANDWSSFVELFRQGGLKEIHEHVRSLERNDPECRTYPRFKQHDDIAAVAICL